MKSLKIFYIVFLAIFIASCEKEPLQFPEENVSETMYFTVNPDGQSEIILQGELQPLNFKSNPLNKSSQNDSDYRLYTSLEDLKNDCSQFRSDPLPDLRASGTVGYHGLEAFYLGVYLEVEPGEDLIDIVIRNPSYEIIYHERRLISDPVFFGIATEEPMDWISFTKVNHDPYGDVITTKNAHVGYCNFIVDTDTDSDGDGVPDEEDSIPNSNMEETVFIEDCDSTVENIALGEGYMLSDKIDELETGEYKNHGQFVRATAHYLKSLVKEGILTMEEKDLIMACAGSSYIGK